MEPSLTVAICTRERPADLEDCLSSVLVDRRVSEVLVSSDGLDLETDSGDQSVCRRGCKVGNSYVGPVSD